MEEKVTYARRDSTELALERKQSNTLARFKETQRKNSGKNSVDSFHDLFYAPNRVRGDFWVEFKVLKVFIKKDLTFFWNSFFFILTENWPLYNRPSQKAVEYFQNRPRTADTYRSSGNHERTPSNSSSCSQSSTLSQSKNIFKSYQDCKRELSKRTVLPILFA